MGTRWRGYISQTIHRFEDKFQWHVVACAGFGTRQVLWPYGAYSANKRQKHQWSQREKGEAIGRQRQRHLENASPLATPRKSVHRVVGLHLSLKIISMMGERRVPLEFGTRPMNKYASLEPFYNIRIRTSFLLNLTMRHSTCDPSFQYFI